MDIKTSETPREEQKEVKTINHARHQWYVGGYVIMALGCLVLYILARLHVLYLPPYYENWVARLFLAGFFSGIVLIIARMAQKIVSKRATAKSAAYNAIRGIRLLTVFVIALIIISFLNANWYTAAASLGLVSLILGFALQTPISSLIGWFYIVIRNPYKVGDRIQVDDFTGDVVEIGYLDTTLWEFAGDYLSNDLPSGRLIRFPNSLVFGTEVYNYSWHKFPYIWNEIPFHVAYESDLTYIEETLRRIAKEELGTDMEARVEELRGVIKQTPVNELEIREYPFVQYRINTNTWVEVLLVYLVEPRRSGVTRSRLIKRILTELLKEPDRAMFPKSNAR